MDTMTLLDRPEVSPVPESEEAARRYLLQCCWRNHQRYCPRCLSRKNYRLGNGRRRCAKCKYTFHDFSGRWLNNCNLTAKNWLKIIHLFLEEATARQVAKELELSYNTAYKAMTTLRFAITAHALDAKQLLGKDSVLDLSLSGRMFKSIPDRQGTTLTPVFGIMDRKEWIFVDLIPGFDAETILHFMLNFQLSAVRQGNVVYTDRYQRYDTLICCVGSDGPANYIKSSDGTVSVDQANAGFWHFAIDRLMKFRGVTPQRFPLYLKELEFRFNNRHKDLFPVLTEYVCDLVPDFS